MSNIDSNRVYVILGQNPSDLAVPVKVSAAGEVIVEFVISGSSSALQSAKVDSNRVYTTLATISSSAVPVSVDTDGRVVISGIVI